MNNGFKHHKCPTGFNNFLSRIASYKRQAINSAIYLQLLNHAQATAEYSDMHLQVY